LFFLFLIPNCSKSNNENAGNLSHKINPTIQIDSSTWDSITVLESLLGTSIKGDRWKTWYKVAPSIPSILTGEKDICAGNQFFFEEEGIDVGFDDSTGIIGPIVLLSFQECYKMNLTFHSECNVPLKKCSQYGRSLPYGLTFNSTRYDVEKTIGKDTLNLPISSTGKGLWVMYDHRGMDGRISSINISSQE
jgi:hypothetical protein